MAFEGMSVSKESVLAYLTCTLPRLGPAFSPPFLGCMRGSGIWSSFSGRPTMWANIVAFLLFGPGIIEPLSPPTHMPASCRCASTIDFRACLRTPDRGEGDLLPTRKSRDLSQQVPVLSQYRYWSSYSNTSRISLTLPEIVSRALQA